MPDDHIKRCDVRVPINLYNEIEKIAVEEYNAPVYHKTGKPQVSSTIIQLLRLGIENLREEVSDNVSDTVSDTYLDKKITHAIDQLGVSLIANLKSDKEFILAIANKVQKISYDDETITQIDKSSLEPIFNNDLDEDEDEDVDWNELKVGELRKVITIKGLGNKFREKLRKSPRESKKAQIVKFLSETSIFDLD